MTNKDTYNVSDALEYLATSADDFAEAVQMEVRLEALKKAVLAELMLASDEKTQSGKEAWAMIQPEYKSIAEVDYPNARRQVAFHKRREKWAETVIEVWRTQNANKRAAEKVR